MLIIVLEGKVVKQNTVVLRKRQRNVYMFCLSKLQHFQFAKYTVPQK
jgi:hypothetical protein